MRRMPEPAQGKKRHHYVSVRRHRGDARALGEPGAQGVNQACALPPLPPELPNLPDLARVAIDPHQSIHGIVQERLDGVIEAGQLNPTKLLARRPRNSLASCGHCT